MPTFRRLALFAILGLCALPSMGFAQQQYPAVRRFFHNQPLTPQEIENHLRAYNRGTLNPYQGVGYSHSGGYGFGGGYGFYYGGGFMPPSYGMTNGLYPYRSIYSYPSNDDLPLPVISRPSAHSNANPSTADGMPVFVPHVSAPVPPAAQPQTFPLELPTAVPLVDPTPPAARRETPSAPPLASNVAALRVILPDASAKVLLDDRPTTSTGRERTFFSPPLDRGGKYAYDIVATWSHAGTPMRVTRTVIVVPGETAVVDFTRPQVGESMEPAANEV